MNVRHSKTGEKDFDHLSTGGSNKATEFHIDWLFP
jgi:hypothetical protein